MPSDCDRQAFDCQEAASPAAAAVAAEESAARRHELSSAFSASVVNLRVLLTSRPPLITDTHSQLSGGAALRSLLGADAGNPSQS